MSFMAILLAFCGSSSSLFSTDLSIPSRLVVGGILALRYEISMSFTVQKCSVLHVRSDLYNRGMKAKFLFCAFGSVSKLPAGGVDRVPNIGHTQSERTIHARNRGAPIMIAVTTATPAMDSTHPTNAASYSRVLPTHCVPRTVDDTKRCYPRFRMPRFWRS